MRLVRQLFTVLLLWAVSCAVPASQAVVIHVAPNGTVGAPGTPGAPVKSIAEAQALARGKLAEMAAGKTPRSAVRVLLAPGTYPLAEPLSFTEADSGTPGYPMSYEAQSPGTAVLSGGLALRNSSTGNSKLGFALPSGTTVDWKAGQQLYVNGRRAVLARQPNEGSYWFVQRRINLPVELPKEQGKSAFATSADASQWLSGLSPEDRARAVLHLYQSWTTGRHRLADSAPAGAFRIHPAAKWPFLDSGSSQRFYVENVRNALDAPGEWLGEPAGITYLRRADDAAGSASAVLPVLERLVVIKGGNSPDRWVQHLELRGLGLEHTRLVTPAGAGLVDVQAAVNVPAALEVDNARNLIISDCRLAHLGGYGIWLRGHVRDTTLSKNQLTDLGAGGIRVGLPSQMASDSSATGGNKVQANSITDTGLLMPGAVGIWVGQSWDNTLSQNLIANTTYTGISVGWTWGYAPATSGRNTVANNLLYNIGQGSLSDMGGIYTLGMAPGTTITGNLIREVRAYPGYGPGKGLGAWGIYLDEGTSEVQVENNVVLGTDSGGFHLHYGRNNALRYNVLANGDSAELRVSRSDPGTRLQVTGNLLMPTSGAPFDAFAAAPDVVYMQNWLAGGGNPKAAQQDSSKCGAGCSRTNAVWQVGPEPRNVSLANLPSALAAPIQQTIARAGADAPTPVSAKHALVGMSRPAVALAGPIPHKLDLSDTPVGGRPEGLSYHPKGESGAIAVVRTEGVADGKCLQFNDGPAWANRFDPHAYATLNHSAGTSTATFTMRFDAQSDFIHEWRDSGTPFLRGPGFTVSGGSLWVNGKAVAPIAAGKWYSFRVSAALGDRAASWALQVTDGGAQIFSADKIPLPVAGWHSLEWLGFISNAVTQSQTCLTGLSVENR